MHVGRAEVATPKLVGRPRVVDVYQVHEDGLNVVDAAAIFTAFMAKSSDSP
jgi:hypothetical protein